MYICTETCSKESLCQQRWQLEPPAFTQANQFPRSRGGTLRPAAPVPLQHVCPSHCQLKQAKKSQNYVLNRYLLSQIQNHLKKKKKVNLWRGKSQCCVWIPACAQLSAPPAHGRHLGSVSGGRSQPRHTGQRGFNTNFLEVGKDHIFALNHGLL